MNGYEYSGMCGWQRCNHLILEAKRGNFRYDFALLCGVLCGQNPYCKLSNLVFSHQANLLGVITGI